MWKCLLFISHSATFVLPTRAAKTLSGVLSAYRLKRVCTNLFYHTGRVASKSTLEVWKILLVYRVSISFRSPTHLWKNVVASDAFSPKYNRYLFKKVTYYSLIRNANIFAFFYSSFFLSFLESLKLTFLRKITILRRLADISYTNLYSKNNVYMCTFKECYRLLVKLSQILRMSRAWLKKE